MREFSYLLLYKAHDAATPALSVDKLKNNFTSFIPFLYPGSPINFASTLACTQTYGLQPANNNITSTVKNPPVNYFTNVSLAFYQESNCLKVCVYGFDAEDFFAKQHIDQQTKSCPRSTFYGITI